jgi:alpha-tubulin suppressor-like RCC1 family protein
MEYELTKPRKVDNLAEVIEIACGKDHSLAMTETQVFAWGSNKHGQCGKKWR